MTLKHRIIIEIDIEGTTSDAVKFIEETVKKSLHHSSLIMEKSAGIDSIKLDRVMKNRKAFNSLSVIRKNDYEG